MAILQSIVNKFPHTPMADKAATLMDVLSRRRQIEAYLTNLQIKKAEDTTTVSAFPPAARPQNNRPGMVRNDSNMLKVDTASDWAKAKARELALARAGSDTQQVARLQRQIDSIRAAGKLRSDTAQLAAKTPHQEFRLHSAPQRSPLRHHGHDQGGPGRRIHECL